MVLLGETHGVAETPAVAAALMQELGLRALAIEWSHEELDEVVQRFVAGEAFDLEALWRLPAEAELFCGDGRFTAGHVALLEALRSHGALAQVILFDRVDPEPPDDWRPREAELAERLLVERSPDEPLLVISGAFHCCLDSTVGTTMAMHLARSLPGLRSLVVEPLSGEGWSREGVYGAGTPLPFDAGVPIRIPRASPAVVPGKR